MSFPTGETFSTGKGKQQLEVDVSLNAIFTASAASSPVTTMAISDAELMSAKVNVILCEGGLGESLMKVTHLVFSNRWKCQQNRDATCPSGPIPSSIRSKLANSLVPDFLKVPFLTNCFRRFS